MLTRLRTASAPLTITGLVMIAVLGAALIGLAVDSRTITNVPAWLKPAKFAVSFAIYTFTLAWIFTLIREWTRTRSIVGWTTAVVMVLEMAIISLQAFRGTTSHFNVATLLDGVLFGTMGAAIVIQTLATIAVAVALWRHQFGDAALGWALRIGMIITILGALTGGMMTGPTAIQLDAARAGEAMTVVGAHTVGAPDGGPGLPGTGWSTEYGDLRIPHFLGLHALQMLPIVALVLGRLRARDVVRVRLTIIAAASYVALYGILLAQALRGQSLLAPDVMTATLLGVWGLATFIAGVTAVFSGLQPMRRPVVV